MKNENKIKPQPVDETTFISLVEYRLQLLAEFRRIAAALEKIAEKDCEVPRHPDCTLDHFEGGV